jgi:hypothetical protein
MSSMMQRHPVSERLFCPTAFVMTFGDEASTMEHELFDCVEVIDSK